MVIGYLVRRLARIQCVEREARVGSACASHASKVGIGYAFD
jgi:hypothetical protein